MNQMCLRNLTIKPYQILCIIVIVIMITLLLESVLPGPGRMGLVPGLTKVDYYNACRPKTIIILQAAVNSTISIFSPPPDQRPANFQSVCSSDPACGGGCDVCCELPYNVNTGIGWIMQLCFSSPSPLQGFSTCTTTSQRRTSGMQEKIGEAPGHGGRTATRGLSVLLSR